MQTETCQNCRRTIGNLETRHLFNGNVVCAQCDAQLRSSQAQTTTLPHTAATSSPASVAQAHTHTQASERVLIEVHPAMFRSKPLLFIVFILLSPVFGAGVICLLAWWLQCRAATLVVTNVRTTIRRGILSKSTNEVRHKDARNIKVSQSLGQRIFGVGTLQVSSAGQSDIEIKFVGLPDPQKVADLIRQYQN